MTSKKVWFVTGCSKGLGHALVKKLLEEGYPVAAASRDAQTLVNVFGSEGDGFLPLSLNIKDEDAVKAALDQTRKKFGRIDVVVNNAGYTHLATIEEMSDADAREEFNINVFSLLHVIRHVLPIMREQKAAISSMSAVWGPIMWGRCLVSTARPSTRSKPFQRLWRRRSSPLGSM